MRRWFTERAADLVFLALLLVLCAMCAVVVCQFARQASARTQRPSSIDLATVYDPPASETEG